MKLNILVVDKDYTLGLELISGLGAPTVDVAFVSKATQAIKNTRYNKYNLIVLGDRLDEGSTYDVALELSTGKKNRHVPVVCMGVHPGRLQKVMGLLSPYAFKYGEDVTSRLKEFFKLPPSSSSQEE